jgi:hypothetical protein
MAEPLTSDKALMLRALKIDGRRCFSVVIHPGATMRVEDYGITTSGRQ